jgi:hypothetical protein
MAHTMKLVRRPALAMRQCLPTDGAELCLTLREFGRPVAVVQMAWPKWRGLRSHSVGCRCQDLVEVAA